ncbi:MAG: SigE family RNA polymerase sigma factor [Nocardioidaceae bacterium]|nr:SigE family RNA polymerase sigma factor [Nocardioidaceae bacterium]NUS52908.1 SigE family RNA polymerase sigma factor [Nocardioidaceae bacterium]
MAEQRRERDEEFAAYMAARQPSLLRTAYLLAGDRHTAEDLVQTTFAKLYLSWDKVQRREVVDGYVRRILVNEHTSMWRRPWKRREVSTEALPEQQRHDRTDEGEASAVWEFVQTLPRKQRAVIVLRYYEDLSEAEIADVLGVSVGTVKSQASRALAAMRARVGDHPRISNPYGFGEEER